MTTPRWRRAAAIAILAVVGLSPSLATAGAVRGNAGFTSNTLAANDDDSTGLVGLGFSINYFGLVFTGLYVNNNGNVTFDGPLSAYTPFDLTSTGSEIIAPYFADVDTRGVNSDEVTYGSDTVGGRPAFGVNWVDVGYFSSASDKLNSFQLVIIDRSDLAPGDVDFEFNYDRIEWESGAASGGSGGLGGSSARAGYSNGTGDPGTFFEFTGSAVNGAFLDGNPTTGLALNSNVGVPGRFLFQVRNGVVEVCGDGVTGSGEQCDDGNNVDGDCCSSDCVFETGPCDDGDLCTTGDVCDGAGTCTGPLPVTCDDGDVCTTDSCDPETGCRNDDEPVSGCLTAGKSILLIKNAADEGKDKLLWKWSKGAAVTQSAFADPTASTDYGLCIYAGSTQALVAGAALPAASGWSALGTKGYKFKGTSPDGLTGAQLKGGASGKSKAFAKGKGAALPDPTLPLAYPVIVQLRKSGSPLCLESAFTIADQVKNDASQFKAKR